MFALVTLVVLFSQSQVKVQVDAKLLKCVTAYRAAVEKYRAGEDAEAASAIAQLDRAELRIVVAVLLKKREIPANVADPHTKPEDPVGPFVWDTPTLLAAGVLHMDLARAADRRTRPDEYRFHADLAHILVAAAARRRPGEADPVARRSALTVGLMLLADQNLAVARQHFADATKQWPDDAELLLTYGIVIDTSFSVRGEPLYHLKQAAHAAVASLRPNDRTALLTFSQVVRCHLVFSSDTAAIDHAIDGVEADGSTALNDAAFAAMGLRADIEGRRLVLLFTDGFDTASWLSPLAVIDHAHRSDVVVDAVLLDRPGAGAPRRLRDGSVLPAQRRRWFLEEPQLFRQEFLSVLAGETGGEVVIANRSGDLRDAFLKIVAAFKTRYVLTYSPRDVAPAGWHPIDVRLKNAKGDVRARRGYTR